MKEHTSHIAASELRSISVVEISGNTFACKDQIKAAGGRWDKAAKVWTVKCSGTGADRSRVAGLTFDLSRKGCTFRSR